MDEQDTFNALRYLKVTTREGTTIYYNANRDIHREDGPAVIFESGLSLWYWQGNLCTKTKHAQLASNAGYTP